MWLVCLQKPDVKLIWDSEIIKKKLCICVCKVNYFNLIIFYSTYNWSRGRVEIIFVAFNFNIITDWPEITETCFDSFEKTILL